MTKGTGKPAPKPKTAPAVGKGFTSMEKAMGQAEVAQKFLLINNMDETWEKNFKAFILGDASLAQLLGVTHDQAYAFAEYAYTLYEQGRIREARQIFEALAIQNPADPYMHFMLGVIYAKLDMPEEAVEEYTISLERDPSNVAAYCNRGEILLQHGEFHDALADLKRCIELDKTGSDPFALRARMLATATADVVKLMMDAGKKKK